MMLNRLLPALAAGVALAGLVACGGPQGPTSELVVDYPLEGSMFPPGIVAPTFEWHDGNEEAASWLVTVEFDDGEPGLSLTVQGGPAPEPEIDATALRETNEIYRGTEYEQSAEHWTPTAEVWEEIKRRSVDRPATITFSGRAASAQDRTLSSGAVTISTSSDPVGAPLFYRDVPLMPSAGKTGVIQPLAKDALYMIKWRLRDLSKPESRVVLHNMPSCANCHSFSNDGTTMGMDVDGPQGDKGAYMIAPVEREMTVTDDEVISWNSFPEKDEGHKTIGFLSRISPDGKFAVTTLNEGLFVKNFLDYRFLQVFFPTYGILGWYSVDTEEMKALPGADDTEYVHCSPVWTPDGETLVFSRAKSFDPTENIKSEDDLPTYAGDPKEPRIQYDLCRMPFNGGKGGKPEPIAGASNNGMSNTFPKVSPDGKWLVWTKCENGLLMRPDGKLWIVPLAGGEPREMTCNTPLMNSWHSFSPNGRWMVFSSKSKSPYTQLFLTHIDENGNDTPAILIPNSTPANRASNLPEFLNASPDAIEHIDVHAVDHHRLFGQAKESLRREQFEEAAALARQAIEKEPGFARARVILGWSLFRLGKSQEGMQQFRVVLEQDPESSEAHHHLGLAMAELGRKEQAMRCFQQAVRYGPTNVEALKSLGLAYLNENDSEKALKAYERAHALAPEDAGALESLAVVLLNRGEVALALTHLEAVCRLQPEDADTRTFLSWCLATSPDGKIRDGERALAWAKEANALTKGGKATTLNGLAAAYAETGHWDEAVATAREAHRLAVEERLPDAPAYATRLRLYEQKKPYRHR
ncbi:MAG: tetratricopeptide repeat protein [Planctomycetota bacterium]